MEYTTDIDGTMDCVKSSPNAVDPRLDEIKKIGRLLVSGHRTILFSDWKVVCLKRVIRKRLRRMVDRICERHQILFAGFLKKLNVESLFEARSSFTHIIDELYSDRQFNWGRIATTFAFAGIDRQTGCRAGNGKSFRGYDRRGGWKLCVQQFICMDPMNKADGSVIYLHNNLYFNNCSHVTCPNLHSSHDFSNRHLKVFFPLINRGLVRLLASTGVRFRKPTFDDIYKIYLHYGTFV